VQRRGDSGARGHGGAARTTELRRRREGVQEGSSGVRVCGSDDGARSHGNGGYSKKAFVTLCGLGVGESSEKEDGEESWDGGAAGRHGAALHLLAWRGEHHQLLVQPTRYLLRATSWGLLLLPPNSVSPCCSNVLANY